MNHLGKENKEEPISFEFDLEKDLSDDKTLKSKLTNVENTIQEIKTAIRKGASQEDYTNLGLLLHGYSSFLKVVTRINIKNMR